MKWSSNSVCNHSPAHLRLHLIELRGTGNSIAVEENVRGRLEVMFVGNNNRIHLGENVSFSEPVIVTMRCNNAVLEIGTGSTSEGSTFHFREDGTSIIVGEDCMFARDTNFWVTDFHSILDLQSSERTNAARQITIENHVWIGWGAKILKNVRVGTGSIVGTASVVTRDVAPHTIAFGVPANEMKSNIDWSRKLL